MAGEGMDPEQLKRTNAYIKMTAESIQKWRECMETLRQQFEGVAHHLQEEANRKMDQEVAGFAAMLDNMTDSQIWREFRGEGRLRGEGEDI